MARFPRAEALLLLVAVLGCLASGAEAREAREPRLAPSAGGVRPVGAARLLVPRALK